MSGKLEALPIFLLDQNRTIGCSVVSCGRIACRGPACTQPRPSVLSHNSCNGCCMSATSLHSKPWEVWSLFVADAVPEGRSSNGFSLKSWTVARPSAEP